jgi:hypothetical protein
MTMYFCLFTQKYFIFIQDQQHEPDISRKAPWLYSCFRAVIVRMFGALGRMGKGQVTSTKKENAALQALILLTDANPPKSTGMR